MLSPGPDDSLYFTSLHFSSQSLRVVSHQQPWPRTIPLFRPRCQRQAKKKFHPKALRKTLGSHCFYFPPCSFFFFAPFPFLLSNRPVGNAEWWMWGGERKCQALLVTALLISVTKAQGSRFDTVRWPGKLKTQLKWQHRGQLFCISKALLWPFCTNYIR